MDNFFDVGFKVEEKISTTDEEEATRAKKPSIISGGI